MYGLDARVTLVGCMHFNPWSIFTAEAVIKSAARGGGEGSGVGAVVIEQCSRRWKRTLDTAPTASLLRLLLANEMQAAADAAERHGARLVLGDQEVDALGKALKREALQTLRDLATPWDGGWGRVAVRVVLWLWLRCSHFVVCYSLLGFCSDMMPMLALSAGHSRERD